MPSNFDLVTTSVDYIGLTLSGYPHVVSYSSIDMLPGIPHIDQLEIERLFDTGAKTGNTVFTIADRRKMFKLPKNWYTINETTKQISILQFSTIANANVTFNLTTGLGLKYYAIDDANTSVVIPNLGANDTIIIRRKTLSEEKIVNFTAGSRLTSGQLNLSSNQLINIIQELLWKVDNEVIIKYDKDAIDGPFLGTFNGAFVDVTGNIDMNGQRVTNLGYSGTLDDAMPKKEITDTVFRHGVITKDTTPTNSPGTQNDIIEGNANEGRSGVWFNPQDGKLRAWAGNNWVIVTNAINPAVNPFLVQTNTAQSLSGQKTFLAPTTFDSTVTMTSNLAVNTNTLLVNTANNRVGINISNPPNSLSVKARNDTTDGFYMDGLSPGPVNTWINLIPNASSGTYNPLTQAGDRLFAFGTTAANQTTSVGLTIAPWSTNAVGLRMAGNGMVGIATSSPDQVLTIQSVGDSQISLKNQNGTTKAYIGTSGAFGSASTDDLRIRSDSTNIIFGFNGQERMRITSGGNVGIGTNNPSATLEVNGTLKASGNTWPQCVMTHAENPAAYTLTGVGRQHLLEITGLTTTITPRTATSKILVTICLTHEINHDSTFVLKRVVNGVETEIASAANPNNNQPYGWFGGEYDTDTASTATTITKSYLDSPNTTNAVTYKLYFYSALAVCTLYVNRSATDANAANYERTSSQCILQEYFA